MTKQLTIRILGAAIALIVLSFAPSVARAHVGHQHQASVHTNHDHTASQEADRSSSARIVAAGPMEGIRHSAGLRAELRRRLLLIRMCRLLRGRAAEPCATRPVSPGDQTSGIGPVPDRAGPQA